MRSGARPSGTCAPSSATASTAAIVTEAMSLSPADPSFLDERDAILQRRPGDLRRTPPATRSGRSSPTGAWAGSPRRADGADTSAVEDFTPAAVARDTARARSPAPSPTTRPASRSRVPSSTSADTRAATAPSRTPDGEYAISFVPAGTYPELIAQTAGVRRRRRWRPPSRHLASRSTSSCVATGPPSPGAPSSSTSTGRTTAPGCGPANAIDLNYGTGWASDVADGDPSDTVDPKFIVVKLPEPVDISSFAIDPSANCGDAGSASMGDYRIEVSLDGEEYSQVDHGTFDAGRPRPAQRAATQDEPLPGVQYVKVWMDSSRSTSPTRPVTTATATVTAFDFSGCSYMDMTEFEVYGTDRFAGVRGPAALVVQRLPRTPGGHRPARCRRALDPSQTPAGGRRVPRHRGREVCAPSSPTPP